MQEDANLLQFGPEFNDCQTLLISEVKVLLELQKEKRMMANTPINPIMKTTIDYCQKFSRFSNKQTVRQVRTVFDVEQFELAQLANLVCHTAEEAKSLIPSLDSKFSDEELQQKLNELQNLAKYQ